MIQLVKKDEAATREFVQQMMQRAGERDRQVEATVAEILENVRLHGDKAVRQYTQKFDGSVPEKLEISQVELGQMVKQCAPEFVAALERAAENIREFHTRRSSRAGWIPRQTA